MTHTIWKTILAPTDMQEIDVPEGAELLTVREQHEQICLWFRCNPSNDLKKRQIVICGTGHSIPEGFRYPYVGTAFLDGGQLVFHIFASSIR